MIRRAQPSEHDVLTTISFRSKAYWSYPDHYFRIWHDELTITAGYIERQEVYVHENEAELYGYYSLRELAEDLVLTDVRLQAGLWLEHMFVAPEHIGRGIGRALFNHCRQRLSERREHCLRILADPYARKFYEKMGCRYIQEYPSSIAGRTTPYLYYMREDD